MPAGEKKSEFNYERNRRMHAYLLYINFNIIPIVSAADLLIIVGIIINIII